MYRLYTVEIRCVGNALGIMIPEELAESLDLEIGDDVTLELNFPKNAIILRKKKEVLVASFSNQLTWA